MKLPLIDREIDRPFDNPEVDASGKRVLITGASGTFGRAIAAELTRRGAVVVGLDVAPRDDDAIPVIACDLGSDDGVAQSVPEAIAALGGGLDILINNAGVSAPTPAEFPPTDAVMLQLQINLLGTWRVTAACVGRPRVCRRAAQVRDGAGLRSAAVQDRLALYRPSGTCSARGLRACAQHRDNEKCQQRHDDSPQPAARETMCSCKQQPAVNNATDR